MLFLQFMLYLFSFVGTLDLCKIKIKQLSPDILKFMTKHKDNPFTLNCSVVSRSFSFVFHVGSDGLDSNNSRKASYKEKPGGLALVSRLSFRFLRLWYCQDLYCNFFFRNNLLLITYLLLLIVTVNCLI